MALLQKVSRSGQTHTTTGASYALNPNRHTPHISKSALVKAALIILAISLLGAASAANQTDNSTKANHQSVQLNVSHNTPAVANNADTSPAIGITNDVSGSSVSSSVTTNSSSSSDTPSVKVSVNGQDVPVPQNGASQHIITTPDGSTSINVSNNHNSSGSSFNSSFTTSNVNSFHSSTITTSNSEHN